MTWKPKHLLVILFTMTATAHARIGLVVGEPFGSFGTMMPAGHAGIYLDHLCADTPTHLRHCHSGEFGVVISRYHDLRYADTDWMATPASVFFYGVDDPYTAPQYMTASLEAELREAYREAHLMDLAPDTIDHHGTAYPARYGDWDESIGAAFDRRLFLYTIDTTPEQDASILALLNDSPDTRRYSLFRANCADFAAEVLNTILPGTFHRNNIADFQMMSPKQDAKLLRAYGDAHPELHLTIYEIPQIPGTLRRSRPIRGAAETLLKTKRYLATLLVIQPEIVLGSWVIYETKGKSKPGLNAEQIAPSFWTEHVAPDPINGLGSVSASPAAALHSTSPSPFVPAAP
jgi:hypothetical protein